MNDVQSRISSLLATGGDDAPQRATQLVEMLLRAAHEARASDVHLLPTEHGLRLKWRIDGVLQPLGDIPQPHAEKVVVRLKVLAKLLTYETHLPQEGRIPPGDLPIDVRVSTFPTVFGEKVVARLLPTTAESFSQVADLGLPPETAARLQAALGKTSGALVIVGPAGSGKTTTAYACLREIVANSRGQRNIVSMEDPVESLLEDVAQSEVSTAAGFDLTSGLRSLVRQDPDVIFVGEIRDPATASIAFQAALTGQLVLTTFHAPDAATAVSRLTDMGIPDYVLRGAINGVVGQQLVRRLCECAEPCSTGAGNLGLPVETWHAPRGCADCQQTGYHGRQIVAELLDFGSSEISTLVQPGTDAKQLRTAARDLGMKTLFEQAVELVATGVTSPTEVVRVFGVVF